MPKVSHCALTQMSGAQDSTTVVNRMPNGTHALRECETAYAVHQYQDQAGPNAGDTQSRRLSSGNRYDWLAIHGLPRLAGFALTLPGSNRAPKDDPALPTYHGKYDHQLPTGPGTSGIGNGATRPHLNHGRLDTPADPPCVPSTAGEPQRTALPCVARPRE